MAQGTGAESTSALLSDIRSDNIVLFAGITDVQKDLGVGDDVARKLTLLRDGYRARYNKERDMAFGSAPISGRFTNEQSQKIIEIQRKLNSEFIPQLVEQLSADQLKRLQQIQFQWRLAEGGPQALLSPEVGSELKLTEDQKQSLSDLQKEMREKQSPGGAGFRANREGMERVAKIREEYTAKAMGVLAAPQQDALRALKGNEFDVSKITPARLRTMGN